MQSSNANTAHAYRERLVSLLQLCIAIHEDEKALEVLTVLLSEFRHFPISIFNTALQLLPNNTSQSDGGGTHPLNALLLRLGQLLIKIEESASSKRDVNVRLYHLEFIKYMISQKMLDKARNYIEVLITKEPYRSDPEFQGTAAILHFWDWSWRAQEAMQQVSGLPTYSSKQNQHTWTSPFELESQQFFSQVHGSGLPFPSSHSMISIPLFMSTDIPSNICISHDFLRLDWFCFDASWTLASDAHSHAPLHHELAAATRRLHHAYRLSLRHIRNLQYSASNFTKIEAEGSDPTIQHGSPNLANHSDSDESEFALFNDSDSEVQHTTNKQHQSNEKNASAVTRTSRFLSSTKSIPWIIKNVQTYSKLIYSSLLSEFARGASSTSRNLMYKNFSKFDEQTGNDYSVIEYLVVYVAQGYTYLKKFQKAAQLLESYMRLCYEDKTQLSGNDIPVPTAAALQVNVILLGLRQGLIYSPWYWKRSLVDSSTMGSNNLHSSPEDTKQAPNLRNHWNNLKSFDTMDIGLSQSQSLNTTRFGSSAIFSPSSGRNLSRVRRTSRFRALSENSDESRDSYTSDDNSSDSDVSVSNIGTSTSFSTEEFGTTSGWWLSTELNRLAMCHPRQLLHIIDSHESDLIYKPDISSMGYLQFAAQRSNCPLWMLETALLRLLCAKPDDLYTLTILRHLSEQGLCRYSKRLLVLCCADALNIWTAYVLNPNHGTNNEGGMGALLRAIASLWIFVASCCDEYDTDRNISYIRTQFRPRYIHWLNTIFSMSSVRSLERFVHNTDKELVQSMMAAMALVADILANEPTNFSHSIGTLLSMA